MDILFRLVQEGVWRGIDLKAVEMLQRVDIGLLEIGLDFEKRKEVLANRLFRTRKGIA